MHPILRLLPVVDQPSELTGQSGAGTAEVGQLTFGAALGPLAHALQRSRGVYIHGGWPDEDRLMAGNAWNADVKKLTG